ncbi:probable 3-hydroxyacyl-CoA dehydrogenase B0272.3 [Danaus plexippus]|uniref:probable 3-hydroxyacyl-CoA dehydrogenase B0272.3 n=1 Tax=Danaus plexippus TaxID=13037 RepID=UPI002AB28C81|nr:probable 3-hydroxyacyl-CoA dehydrogenase B0272.3 [Danaus plexippus]
MGVICYADDTLVLSRRRSYKEEAWLAEVGTDLVISRIERLGLRVAAQAGQNVTIVDLNSEILEKAQKSIQNNLGRVARKLYKDDPLKIKEFVKEANSRIKVSTKIEDGVDADLIVEAIVELLEPKQKLFNRLDELAPEHTILASNTSSISINEIGSGIKRKDR